MPREDIPDKTLGENDDLRVIERGRYQISETEELTLIKHMPDQRGRFFLDLVARWGMVAGVRGEDTAAGHPVLELLSPASVVCRAATMTVMAFNETRSQGWMVDLERPVPAANDA